MIAPPRKAFLGGAFFILYNAHMGSRLVFVIISLSFVFSGFLQVVFYSFYFSYFLLSLAFLALLFAALERDKIFLYFALFFISAAVFSFYLLHAQSKNEKLREHFLGKYPDEFSAELELISPPDKRGDYSFLTLKLCEKAQCVNVRAKSYSNSALGYGDTVRATLKLKRFENFDSKFNYEKFMENKNILLEAELYEMDIIARADGVLTRLYGFKEKLKDNLFSNLSYDSAALAAGLLLGEKQALDKQTAEIFQKSGLMHIVVLSGYNISIISIALFYILSFLPRKTRLLLSILFIAIFVLMVGPDAPTLRAGLMGSLALLALLARRHADAGHLLFLSATIVMLFNPLSALYDPGFQLSYVVTLAIISFAPYLIGLRHIASLGFLKETLISSIVAFLSASPIIAYYMGSASLSAVFANMFVLPLVPLAMAFSAPLMFAKDAVMAPLAFFAEFLLKGILHLAEIFAIDSMQLAVPISGYALLVAYFIFLIFCGASLLRAK